jgi:hypothetical protein
MRKLHIKEPAISYMLGIKSVTGEVNPSTGTPAHNKNVKVSTGAQVVTGVPLCVLFDVFFG